MLTHINEKNNPHMVDVAQKPTTQRIALASGRIYMNAAALAAARENSGKKGAVIATAICAGVMAAKRTAELVPMCHTLMLSKVEIDAVDLAEIGDAEGDLAGVGAGAGSAADGGAVGVCGSPDDGKFCIGEEEFAGGYELRAMVKTSGQTGVEMEALTAVSVALLTVYDMLKALDKTMLITDIKLLEKSGGKSGEFKRN